MGLERTTGQFLVWLVQYSFANSIFRCTAQEAPTGYTHLIQQGRPWKKCVLLIPRHIHTCAVQAESWCIGSCERQKITRVSSNTFCSRAACLTSESYWRCYLFLQIACTSSSPWCWYVDSRHVAAQNKQSHLIWKCVSSNTFCAGTVCPTSKAVNKDVIFSFRLTVCVLSLVLICCFSTCCNTKQIITPHLEMDSQPRLQGSTLLEDLMLSTELHL